MDNDCLDWILNYEENIKIDLKVFRNAFYQSILIEYDESYIQKIILGTYGIPEDIKQNIIKGSYILEEWQLIDILTKKVHGFREKEIEDRANKIAKRLREYFYNQRRISLNEQVFSLFVREVLFGTVYPFKQIVTRKDLQNCRKYIRASKYFECIKKILRRSNAIVISSPAGVGKTQLIRDYVGNELYKSYGDVCLYEYGSVADILESIESEYRNQNLSYADILKTKSPRSLICMDIPWLRADDINKINEMQKYEFKLIVSTRSIIENSELRVIYINQLPDNILDQILLSGCPVENMQNTIRNLKNIYCNNTLILSLLNSLIVKGKVNINKVSNPQKLWEEDIIRLRQKNIYDSQTLSIVGHIKRMLKLNDYDDMEMSILYELSILSKNGIEEEAFIQWSSVDDKCLLKEKLNKMYYDRWIQYKGKNKIIEINSITVEVLWREAGLRDYTKILDNLLIEMRWGRRQGISLVNVYKAVLGLFEYFNEVIKTYNNPNQQNVSAKKQKWWDYYLDICMFLLEAGSSVHTRLLEEKIYMVNQEFVGLKERVLYVEIIKFKRNWLDVNEQETQEHFQKIIEWGEVYQKSIMSSKEQTDLDFHQNIMKLYNHLCNLIIERRLSSFYEPTKFISVKNAIWSEQAEIRISRMLDNEEILEERLKKYLLVARCKNYLGELKLFLGDSLGFEQAFKEAREIRNVICEIVDKDSTIYLSVKIDSFLFEMKRMFIFDDIDKFVIHYWISEIKNIYENRLWPILLIDEYYKALLVSNTLFTDLDSLKSNLKDNLDILKTQSVLSSSSELNYRKREFRNIIKEIVDSI